MNSTSAAATATATAILFFSLILFIASLCFGGCIQTERDALLQFKNGLSDPSNRLADWVTDGSDCCRWTGVVCHNITAHVLELHLRTISWSEYEFLYDKEYEEYVEYHRKTVLGGKLSSCLLQLKHLSYLDLSFNDFGGIPIPKFFGSLQSLRYLNLSGAQFGGIIPPHLGNLSNLQYLNVYSSYMYDLNVEKLDWISRLSSLEFLDMTGVDLSRSFDWLKVFNSLPALLELHLSGCKLAVLNPLLPNVNLSSLFVIDLSDNDFNSSIPNWLYDLTDLQHLNLGYNQLQGQISSGIGNLTSLVSLGISGNTNLEFEKGIPNSFRNFCNLISLSMTSVKFNQEINDILAIMSAGCVSNVLQSLDLSNCKLSGRLTDDLRYFKNLTTFRASYNLISGPIPLPFGEMNSLAMLDLSNNRLNGTLPVSFGNLKKLWYVDISNNKLEGEVSQLHFANLTELSIFRASRTGKNISLRVSSNWIPPLQLQTLELRSWHIGSRFPKWLRRLKHLTMLDLSDSGISTPIPIWFWDSISNNNFYYLNFSHNQMHGYIPNISFANADMPLIDLSSNNFRGAVPYFSSNVIALDLSNNSFSGSIYKFLCFKTNEEKRMQILNLEKNFLHDEIPDCWKSWKNLVAVKLNNNKFRGKIPDSIGTLSFLQLLNLRSNNLFGEIPSIIQNCKKLAILDFSENNLVGNIPTWIGDGFTDLSILSLHANKFDSYLPKELCSLVSLHILDLAHNSFSGTIPSCFSNFIGMTTRNDSTGIVYASYSRGAFRENSLLAMKGKVMEYSTNLGFVRNIDLSNNKLSGEIPTKITSIAGLLSLNLSRNGLTGRIPNNIGDMKGLEAIDFSRNRLSGEIPESMSTLTFLSILDLSYNNFSGRILLGTQLQSFDSSSFMGNQLCGLPLIKNCTLDKVEPNTEEKDGDGDGDEVDFDVWFYVSMAFGFVFGFWSIVGSLVFVKRWRHFYFRSVSRLGEKVWWNCIHRFH